jgi:hypothetical protein
MDDSVTERRARSLAIGDDWVLPVTLIGDDGQALSFSGLLIGATYFAPTSAAAPTDLTSTTTIGAAPGAVTVLVPHAITSGIAGIPAGRPQPLVHVQVFTTDAAGLKRTRRVVLIAPFDPATVAPPAGDGDPDYQPACGWVGRDIP